MTITWQHVESDARFLRWMVREWIMCLCTQDDDLNDVYRNLALVCKRWDVTLRSFPRAWKEDLPWTLPIERHINPNDIFRCHVWSMVWTPALSFRVHAQVGDRSVYTMIPDEVRDTAIATYIHTYFQSRVRGKTTLELVANPKKENEVAHPNYLLFSNRPLIAGESIVQRAWTMVLQFVSTYRTSFVFFVVKP